jgi:hypothetical protein
MAQRSSDPVHAHGQPHPTGLRLDELILTLTLATDVGSGAPMESALCACWSCASAELLLQKRVG